MAAIDWQPKTRGGVIAKAAAEIVIQSFARSFFDKASVPVATVPSHHFVALGTIVRREMHRILRIWGQTLVPPAITMTLYVLIFGTLIGAAAQVRHAGHRVPRHHVPHAATTA